MTEATLPPTVKGYEFHPICLSIPYPDKEDADRLRESIRSAGKIHDPVVLWNRKILDGRCRQQFGIELGIEVPYVEMEFASEEEAEQFSNDKNKARRHLTREQLALKAAAKASRGRGRPTHENGSAPTVREAAAAAGITEAEVARGKAVLEKGTPELVDAVKKGEVALPDAASIVHQPEDVQKQAVEAVKAGKEKTAKAAADKAPGAKQRPQRAKKNGSVLYDWKTFDKNFGSVMRVTDDVAKAYKIETKYGDKAKVFQKAVSGFKSSCDKMKVPSLLLLGELLDMVGQVVDDLKSELLKPKPEDADGKKKAK